MANAADYLRLDTTQLINTYKLRTRNVQAKSFVATNIAPNYILSVTVDTNLDGISVSPPVFRLQPNESVVVTVEYDTAALELFPAGTLNGAINMTVAAAPVVIPEIPTSPAQTPLPEAPRQIISRIQITPTNYTLSELGEVKQYNAILYVDDTPLPEATFSWSLDNNLAEAFSIDNGLVKSLKPGINRAVVVATCITPPQYAGTVGLSNTATNIPVIINTNPNTPPSPTTGNLTVIIRGIPTALGANVNISGINQSITKTTTFNNISAGTYTVTPNVVTNGGENWNPSGGGQVYVEPGTTREITIDYTLQSTPDENTISILEIFGPNGKLSQDDRLFVGDRFNVVVQTYRNGQPAEFNDVQVNATNTTEGVKTTDRGTTPGKSSTTFTVSTPGTITISAIGAGGKSVTGTLNGIVKSVYTIKISRPQTIIAGQCTGITATVLKDGIETNIPVTLQITNNLGIISETPCEPIVIPRTSTGGGTTGTVTDTVTSATTVGGTGDRSFNQTVTATRPGLTDNLR